MTRDDSVLYTGASSASFGVTKQQQALADKRKEQREKKAEKRIALSPAADVIKAEIQKEITALIYGPYVDEDSMSDEQFRTERRARKLAVASLLSIQNRLNATMREINDPRSTPNT